MFKRRTIPDREQRVAERQQRLGMLLATARPREAVCGGSTTGPVPKPEARYVDKALTDMAQRRPCLLMVPATCNHRQDTSVACHSNWSEHGGKAGARKADDTYTVWGCAACHYWLDFGKASAAHKERAFMEAHARQVLAWRLIAMDQSEPLRFRRAAARALERLSATPLALHDGSYAP